jgi:penicillin-binding protein 1C
VADGLRAEGECTRGALERVETARWPAVLEPWLEPALRRKALPPAWSKECSTYAQAAPGLKITGASDGEILHRAGDAAPLVRLELRGSDGFAHWMINGRLVARTGAGERYTHRFAEAGRYEITAFDAIGHFDRLSVSVR